MHRFRTLSALTLGLGLSLSLATAQAEIVLGSRPSIISTAPGRTDVDALTKAQAALKSRQYELAERLFGDAYKLNPRSVEAMLGLAAACQAQGKSKLARDWMSSAVAMAPGQAVVLQAQARLLVEMGLLVEAEESYRAAIANHPGMMQLKLDLASLYLEKLKKPAQAVALLREVVKQNPESASAQLGLGLALSAEGKIEEAAPVLDEAVRRDPNNAAAHQAQGLVALRVHQPEKALAAFDRALALRKDFAAAMIGRGDALLALGKGQQAVDVYAQAAIMAPQSALPYALRGQAFERMKRLPEAEAAYREALRIAPDEMRVVNNLAFVLASQKLRLDEALSLAQRAVTKEPNRATFQDTLGVVYLARNEPQAARQAFEKGLSLEPGNVALLQRIAQLGGTASPAAAKPVAVAPASAGKSPVVSAAAATTPVVASTAAPVAKAAASASAVVAAAPSAAPAAAADPAKLVAGRMEAWRQAWEAKDVSRYLAFYASAFVPADKKARSAWEADRRVKLAKKGDIRVAVDGASYKVDGEVVSVTFDQRYQSGNYSDSGRKVVEWVKDAGEWKIRREAQL